MTLRGRIARWIRWIRTPRAERESALELLDWVIRQGPEGVAEIHNYIFPEEGDGEAPVNAKAPTEPDLSDEEALRLHWNTFCDADPVPEDFIDRMERAGFAGMRAVIKSDLDDEFAAERGIRPGGSIWVLTEAGRAAFNGGGR